MLGAQFAALFTGVVAVLVYKVRRRHRRADRKERVARIEKEVAALMRDAEHNVVERITTYVSEARRRQEEGD